MKNVKFMEVTYIRDGGATKAVITVPFFAGRITAVEDAIRHTSRHIVGEGWIQVAHKERGNVE